MKSIENRIMRIKPLILILTASLLFFGCATPQQVVHFPDTKKTMEDTSKGRIYVIRPGLTGLGISTDISVDGEIIGSTGPQSYLCWEQEPGNVTISAKADNVSEIEVNILAGQAKYIVQKLHFGLITTDNQLTVVSEAEGQEALKKCKPPTADMITNTAATGLSHPMNVVLPNMSGPCAPTESIIPEAYPFELYWFPPAYAE